MEHLSRLPPIAALFGSAHVTAMVLTGERRYGCLASRVKVSGLEPPSRGVLAVAMATDPSVLCRVAELLYEFKTDRAPQVEIDLVLSFCYWKIAIYSY